MAQKKQEMKTEQFFSLDLRELPHNSAKKICEINSACAIKIFNLQGILNFNLTFWLYNSTEKTFLDLPIYRGSSETFVVIPQEGTLALLSTMYNNGNISFDYKIIYF